MVNWQLPQSQVAKQPRTLLQGNFTSIIFGNEIKETACNMQGKVQSIGMRVLRGYLTRKNCTLKENERRELIGIDKSSYLARHFLHLNALQYLR